MIRALVLAGALSSCAVVRPLVAENGDLADYLESLRAALHVPVPKGAKPLLRAVEPVVVRERRERGPALATIYHLVKHEDVRLYRTAFERNVIPGASLTGPWPPFAFTPRLF